MFLGDYQHTLDAKGRVSLPAKFRSQMPGRVVVVKGFENCLYVYLPAEYEAFISGLLGRTDFDPRVREIKRFFTAGAYETELDSAGRIMLPATLREWANLSRDVAVTGSGNRIEIWDAGAWSTYNGETAAQIGDLARELADAGLL